MSGPTEAIVKSRLGSIIVRLLLQQILLRIIYHTWSDYMKNRTSQGKTTV